MLSRVFSGATATSRATFSFARNVASRRMTIPRLPKKLQYPSLRRSDFSETLHGQQVDDPYRYLEDPDCNETRGFVDAENATTQELFSQIPYVEEAKNRLTELFDYEKYSCPTKVGGRYYAFSKNDGLQNQAVVYLQDSPESEPRVLLDPNQLSSDGTAALSSTAFSEGKASDALYFAHGISRGGSDWVTVKVIKVGKDEHEALEDSVEWVKFSHLAWMHDDSGFFYSRFPSPKSMENDLHDDDDSKRGTETDSNLHHQIWFHALGDPQAKDTLVYAYPKDPSYTMQAEVSDDGKYLLVSMGDGCKNANMLHIADLSNFHDFRAKGSDDLISMDKIVDNMDYAYHYIMNDGSTFYFKTNWNAPRERLVSYNMETKEWKEVIPEQDDKIVLEGVYPVGDKYVVAKLLQDVCNVLRVYDINGTFRTNIELPTVGTVGIASKRFESEVFFKFVSFLYPGSIYRMDFSKSLSDSTLFRETKVKNFDPSQYEAKQVFYPSKDGTKIPMFLVKKKGDIDVSNGGLPTYLYGYGGFNISLSPMFSVSRLVFVHNFGGMLALPNLRGGGEYGEEWHQDGMLHKKQNVFDDFHAAAEYLVQEKYTTPDRIALHGGSNGGLLVAACCNQRPELYGCGVAAVGVMDMLRFHKFTIGHAWRSDYGDPDVEDDFHYLRKYSPLHTVPSAGQVSHLKDKGGFPAMLLTTGDHDDRVVPLHSFKLIAELQHQLGDSSDQMNPLVIRIDTKSGHGAGKPTAKVIEEAAETYGFMAWCIGATFEA